ncbi:TPA: Rep protein, partial [Enterococcus faecalis]|nr:Rep protein [Enterococcus faecalis]
FDSRFKTLQQNQIYYIWNQKEYLASELHELTEEEKRKINHQTINEIEEEK